MSLINQMLRDLAQRQPHQIAVKPSLQVKTSFAGKTNKSRWFWILTLISLIPSYFWYQDQHQQLAQLFNISQLLTDTIKSKIQPSAAIQTNVVETDTEHKPTKIDITTPTKSLENTNPIVISNSADKISLISQTQPIAPPIIDHPIPKPLISNAVKTIEHTPVVEHKIIESKLKTQARNTVTTKVDNSNPRLADKPINKAVTRHDQVTKLYQQAQVANSAVKAREDLEMALALEPEFLPARSLLLQILLKNQASSEELTAFLDESLHWFPEQLLFVKARAHIYIQHKDFNAAAAILEHVDSHKTEDTVYLALLAACYQQLQQFVSASEIYLRLCRLQPDKAENWLGLAITYDKLNQKMQASHAFQQALEKNTLNLQIIDYIKQRLSVLNQ